MSKNSYKTENFLKMLGIFQSYHVTRSFEKILQVFGNCGAMKNSEKVFEITENYYVMTNFLINIINYQGAYKMYIVN